MTNLALDLRPRRRRIALMPVSRYRESWLILNIRPRFLIFGIMNRPFKFTDRIRSFKFAGQGIWLTLKTQPNVWIHAAATLLVLIAGYVLGITRIEWCLLTLASAAVWTAEALNTALEYLADATTKEFHPDIGRAKDVAAGAVLIAAIAALVVGIFVFGPYIFMWARVSR